jgi:VWFA-related protein
MLKADVPGTCNLRSLTAFHEDGRPAACETGMVPMRRLMLLVFLALLMPYAGAAKRVTVAQLEQALTAAQTAHKPDPEIARQIGGLELSERLTEATLNRLTASLDAGSQAARALQLLADQSAFLDPPASELPSTAAPDDATQQRMIDAARTYVAKIVPQLPRLFAIQTTNGYDDRPQEIKKGGWPVRAGLHLVNTSSREISVFEEQTNESTTAASARSQEQSGLVSGGEFGSTLSPRGHSTHHDGRRHERQRPVQEGRDPGSVRADSNRREPVHLPGAQPGSLVGCQRRRSRPADPHAGKWADPMVERKPVHRLSPLRNHDEDCQGFGGAATRGPGTAGPCTGSFSPSRRVVVSKQKEEIPVESKPAAVPELPASLPAVPPAHELTQPAPDAQNTPTRIEVNVNRAFVPVVVRDKQGHAVADLKKEDFQVFERGKAQVIAGFTVEKREVTESAPASAAPVSTPNAPLQPPLGPPLQPAVLPQRITVYLFDDLHLGAADLAYLKKIDAKALDGALVGSDMAAVVSTSGKVNSGLTRDRAKLHDAIMSPQPTSLYTGSAAECPKIEYYEADLIENKHDGPAFAKALAQVFACDPALDRQRDLAVAQTMVESAARRVLTVGDQDVQVTLATIKEVVRRMVKLPGQRTLILVSPGFVSIMPESLSWESQIMDLAVQSNVTINALDARGLYTGVTDISERGGSQIIDPTHLAAMTRAEGVMSELADGTGGAFFHNSNDLGAGFKSLTDAPEIVYVLELSLDGVKPDGSYHRVEVKVDREGMQIKARKGYSAPKQEKTKK